MQQPQIVFLCGKTMGPEITESSIILHTPDKGEHYTVPFTPGLSVAFKFMPLRFGRSNEDLTVYEGDDASITLENFFPHGVMEPKAVFILPDLVEIEALELFTMFHYEIELVDVCKHPWAHLPHMFSSGLNSYMALAGRLVNGVDALDMLDILDMLDMPDEARQEPGAATTSLQPAFWGGNFTLAEEWEGFTPADASLIISPSGINYPSVSPQNISAQNVSAQNVPYDETATLLFGSADSSQPVAFASSAGPGLALILDEGLDSDFTGLYAATFFEDATEQRLQFAAGQEFLLAPGNQPESFEALHLDLDDGMPRDLDIDALLANLADLSNEASQANREYNGAADSAHTVPGSANASSGYSGDASSDCSIGASSDYSADASPAYSADTSAAPDSSGALAPRAAPEETGLTRVMPGIMPGVLAEALDNGTNTGYANKSCSLPQHVFEPYMPNDAGIQATTLHVYLQIAS